MVGAEGFEPPALCSQSRCATRLRYAPTVFIDCIANWIEAAKARFEHPSVCVVCGACIGGRQAMLRPGLGGSLGLFGCYNR